MGGSKDGHQHQGRVRQDDAEQDRAATRCSALAVCRSRRSSSRASACCSWSRILALVGLYVMLALGLNIVVGYAGLLDLGYIAFYAIGAYAGVIVGIRSRGLQDVPGRAWLPGISYFVMIPVAAAFAALTGIALGTPVLRLRGDYLAIVTLGLR